MSLTSFFSSLPKKSLALTHSGADVDAVASAGALYYAFKGKITVGIPEHLNLNAKSFAEKMEIPFELNPDLNQFEALVLVDFNSSSQIGKLSFQLKEFAGKIALIDHHFPSGEELTQKQLMLCDKNAVSTTELIYDLLKKLKKPVNGKIASILAAGFIADSAGFYAAKNNDFRIFAELMEKSDKSYPEIISMISLPIDFSEKIARLKAAKRVRIFKSDDFILVSSEVSAFEATAASTLVKIGADTAFAGDVSKGLMLVSGRASNTLISKGFSLAKHVFEPLALQFNGTGGGHAGAAAFNAKGRSIKPVMDKCIELTHEFIQKNVNKGAQLKEYE